MIKSFFEYIVESGGKRILGANPLQMDTTKALIRHLNQWNEHIKIISSQNHNKIFDNKTGKLIHTFTSSSSLGPKAAIYALSIIRDHLVSIGAIKLDKNETKGVAQRRKSQEVIIKPASAIPEISSQQRAEKLARLRSTILQRFGTKKAGRVQRAMERLARK